MNRINNNAMKQNNTFKQNIIQQPTSFSISNVFGIILLVIILFAFAGSAYWLYNYYTTLTFITPQSVEVLSDVTDATNKTNISTVKLPSSKFSNEYSISFWININDYNYNYGKEKVIMRRGNAGSGNPEIVLDSKKNDLIVRVKLQGGLSKSVSSSTSSFTDILMNINSHKAQTQTQCGGVSIDKEEPYYTYGKFEVEYNKPSFKVGDNTIDYPTIQYTMGTGINSSIINDKLLMGHEDTVRVSSENDYFKMISGNNANGNNTNGNNEGFNNQEGFTDIDDAINASVQLIVDICDIAASFQDVSIANTSVDSLNIYFDTIISTLEQTRTGSKTSDDVQKAFIALMPKSTSNIDTSSMISSPTLKLKFTKLINDFDILAKYKTVALDMNTVIPILNAKMSSINCPLTIDGVGEVDNTISFYENIIKLYKKTIFTFINNMGVGIRKTYPDLLSGSASCGANDLIPNDPTVGTCKAQMIPLQKWVNVIVSVYNQIVDIYIDGQLTSSCVLKGFPDVSTDNVDITPDGGFNGNIARVNFMNTAMTVTHAKKIYYDGPILTDTFFSMIPSWVWWAILALVFIAILYSFLA